MVDPERYRREEEADAFIRFLFRLQKRARAKRAAEAGSSAEAEMIEESPIEKRDATGAPR